jgi:hypothetical protein
LPTTRSHIGELDPVVEPGHLAFSNQRPAQRPDLAELATKLRQPLRALRVEASPRTEQVGTSRDPQTLGDGLAQCRVGSGERLPGDPGLRAREVAEPRSFLSPGRRDGRSPQQRQLRRAAAIGWHPESGAGRIEEAVALADQAVEVGKRMDLLRPLGAVVRDHREPEPELGEAHRGAVPVDAEEIPLQDAPPRRGCRTVGGVKRGESLERAEKEGAGPHGGVEDSEPADGPPG